MGKNMLVFIYLVINMSLQECLQKYMGFYMNNLVFAFNNHDLHGTATSVKYDSFTVQ